MKKTCGTWALVYVVCAVFMGLLARHRLEQAALPGGLIGGAILWLGLGYLAGIAEKRRKSRLLSDAMFGVPPRDGELVAVVGHITPVGESLYSPFKRTQCVAYEYKGLVNRRKSTSTDYLGAALTPSVIQGPRGTMNILAWPTLDVPSSSCNGDEEKRNAVEYAAKTEFTPMKMLQAEETEGTKIRYDHRSVSATELQNASLWEKSLPVGQPVCAFGHYSAGEGGLRHDPKSLLPSLTIMNGDPDVVRSRFARRSIGNFIGGLIFIGLALGAFVTFYALVPLTAVEQMKPGRAISWWEVKLQRMTDRYMKPVTIVPTNLSPGQAFGRVEVAGQNAQPTRATATEQGEQITITFDNAATATVDASTKRLTHLEMMGRVIALDLFEKDGQLEIIERTEEGYEGRITYLGDDARCRIVFNARWQ